MISSTVDIFFFIARERYSADRPLADVVRQITRAGCKERKDTTNGPLDLSREADRERLREDQAGRLQRWP